MWVKSFTVRNIFSFTIKTIRPIGTQPADLVWLRNGPLCKVLWIVVHNKEDFLPRRSWTWRIWTLAMSCSLIMDLNIRQIIHIATHPSFPGYWRVTFCVHLFCNLSALSLTHHIIFLTGLHYRNPYPRAVSKNHNGGHFLSELVLVLW